MNNTRNHITQNVNFQDFEGIFKYMDETMQLMLPKAEIRYASMICSGDPLFVQNPFCQQAFITITHLIEQRPHISFDSHLPLRRGYMERDLTHMKDWESIELWLDVLKRFQ